MNPRLIAVLITLALLALVLGRGCAGPEEQIRRRIHELAADFSTGRPGPTVSHLTDRFTDVESGLGKGEIRGILAQMSLGDRTDDGTFLHRLSFPDESIVITLDEDEPTRARVECIGVFEIRGRRDESWKLQWRVALTGRVKESDDGWQLDRVERRTLEGRPFR